jgi:hypothetical protein
MTCSITIKHKSGLLLSSFDQSRVANTKRSSRKRKTAWLLKHLKLAYIKNYITNFRSKSHAFTTKTRINILHGK